MRSRAALLMSTAASVALATGLVAAQSANAACPDVSSTTVGLLVQGAQDVPVAVTITGATKLEVAAAPPATTGSIGVLACGAGVGTVGVTSAGLVVSHDGDGVDAYGENGAVTLKQTGGQVSGEAGHGLFAAAQGLGSVTISTGANATTTGGAGQAAIDAAAQGGNVGLNLHGTVGSGGVTATTTGAGAIDAKISGAVSDGVRLTTVDGNNSLLVYGAGTVLDGGAAGGTGVEVDTWDGLASVTSQAGTTISSSGGNAVSVQAVVGAVNINLHGQVATAPIFGGNGVAALIATGSGGESIRVGDITAGNTAIAAGNGGTGDTQIISNGTLNAAGDGIQVSNFSLGSGGLAVMVNGDITSGGSGVDAESEATAAPLTITVKGAAITTASGPWAVRGWQAAPIGDAPVTIVLNDATVVNFGGDGVMALANADGSVTVALHGASKIDAEGGSGIWARGLGTGAVNISLAAGDTVKGLSDGVFAFSLGGGDVTVTGAAGSAIASSGSTGVFADSVGGTVTVNLAGAVTAGSGPGVVAQQEGAAGDISVRTADVSAGNIGIETFNFGSGQTRIVANGDVNAGAIGIFALDLSPTGGPISITASGAVTAANEGVFVTSQSMSSTIDVVLTNSASVTAGGAGIRAEADATSGDTAINVTLRGAAVNAQDTALLLTGNAAGALNTTLTDGSNVASTNGYGLSSSNVDGSTTISLAKGSSLQGLQGGILAAASGAGPVTITAASDTSIYSFNGTAIVANSAGGDVAIKALGSITTDPVFGGNGVVASTGGAGNLNVITDGAISATNTIAVSNGGSGTTTVVNRGVLTGLSGISAVAYTFGAGAVDITTNGDIKTLGAAIDAVTVATNSSLAVNVGKGAALSSVWGSWTVRAWAQAPIGDTTVSLLLNGATVINQSGDAVLGINYANGPTSVTLGGASTAFSSGSYGIETNAAAGLTSIVIGKGSSAIGAGAGVYATASGGAVSVSNDGAIGNMVTDHSGAAVAVSGAAGLTLSNANSGLIDGRVTASDNVTFANGGTWKTTGASDFGTDKGAPFNSLTNTGLIQAAYDDPFASKGSPFAASSFDHLGAFNNGSATTRGVVSMLNGAAGDSLTISGLFTGAPGHSVLAVDAFLGGDGSIADELHLLGGSAGKTRILVNDVNPGDGAVNKAGIVLVTGVTATNAFVLDPSSPNYDTKLAGIDHGFYLYQLNTIGGVAELTSRPGAAAAHAPSMLTGLQQIWGATAFSGSADGSGGVDHLGFANGAGETPRLWMTASNWSPSRLNVRRDGLGLDQFGSQGGGVDASVQVSQGYVSQAFSGGSPDVTIDAGYAQTTASLVSGVDLARGGGGGRSFALGVASGYVQSDQVFAVGADRVSYDGALVGVYGSYARGKLRLDGDVRATFLKAHYVGAQSGSASDGHANVVGGVFSATYSQSAGAHWTLQPMALVSVAQASISDLHPYGGMMRFSGGGSAKAGVGLRLVGQARTQAWDARLAATAQVWNEFLGTNVAAVGRGEVDDIVVNQRFAGVSGDFGLRLDLLARGSRFSAFAGGAYRVRSDLGGAAFTAGFGYRW